MTKRTVPFFYKIVEELNKQISKEISQTVTGYQVAKAIHKGNKKTYILHGKEVSIEDTELFNIWHFHHKSDIQKNSHPAMDGATISVQLTCIFIASEKLTTFWNILNAFKYEKRYSTRIGTDSFTGSVIPTSNKDDFYEIVKEFFPNNLAKAEKLQTEYQALAIRYNLKCESVCKQCVEI